MGQAEAGKMGPHFLLYTPYDIFRKKHKFSVFISTIIVATIIANSVVRMIRKSVVKFSRER